MTAISVTLMLTLMFYLTLFRPAVDLEFFGTIIPFVNLVDRAVSQPVCLNTVKHRFFSPFFHLFNEQKSMSSESLGLQSIFISPKIVEHIFPEPASFSSKLGTLPPYTALAPERKRDVSVFENEIYRATTHRCRSDGMMF